MVEESQNIKLAFKQRLGLTLAAALLYVLAFDPFGIWPLIWIALIPFLLALRGANPRLAFRLGMLFGIVVFGILLHWFVGIFGLFGILLPLIPAVFMGLFALLFSLSENKYAKLHILLVPLFWVGLEFFRSELWYLRFSWLTPGYCQHAAPLMIQSASLLGCYGITFLIVAFNSFVARLIAKPKKREKLILLSGIAVIVVFVPLQGFLSMPIKPGKPETVALVQSEKGYAKCLALSREYVGSGGKAPLIVWPEYSTRHDLTEESLAGSEIMEFCRESGVQLILGAIENTKGNRFYNTAFYIDDKGEVAGKFVKAYPVQFFNDGIPGEGREPLNETLGVLICYDLSYPEVARNLVQNGARVLIVPTMDAYSWGSWQHKQHAAVAALRAVETRRWVVRAASSGVSMIVSSYGIVSKKLGYGEEGVLPGSYSENTCLTAYVRFGFLFPWLCLLVTAMSSIALIMQYFCLRKLTCCNRPANS